ncbi:hypothetical protein FRC03_001455 [Tulasnella sp. 419]|nr:hypothetical protein FRC03_001455 [Tulasnella sp. 419]
MEKLIAGPLRGVTDAPNTVVIVMDALDECSNEKLVREILILLEMTIRELPFHAKVFVTSRPDAHIRARFSEDVMQTVSEASILHDIDLSVVQSDIRIYLMHQLREVGREILKSDTWPTQAEVEALVERAGGLFIYASASVMYIGDTDHREPRERLKVLLDDSPISGESPYEEIDKLYRHILASSLPKTRTGALDVAKKLQPIIGTIVTLLDPLPVHAMEKLMSVEETYIQPKLRPLHSILLVPDDPEDLIRIFHKSFPDFMTNPQRCQDPRFLVVRRDFFTQLALQCILLMNSSLHKNMCDIQYPFSMNSDISNLELLLKAKVGTHVLYACRFWAFHLQHADPKDELREAMTIFVTTKLLYWLEVLSLSQHLDHAQPSLKMAQVWYKEEEPKRPGLLQKMMPVLEPLQVFNEALNSAEGKRLQSKTPVKILLSDCQSLLLRFNQSITKSACHIYHSALGLAPYCPLYKQYQKEAEHSVRVLSRAYTWDSLITIFRGQFQRIGAICFSPDGLKIASGSDDRRIYLWDSNTGITIKKLMGHTEGINSLSFSSDGLVLASASHDNTVKLWDSTTGTQLHTLHGHSDSVSSVCFSPKVPHLAQQYVVSGSHDGTICVSDAATGAHIKKIDAQYASEGATIRVLSVSLSPDGSFIASGSQDAMVYIWEFATGSCHKQLKGHNESVGSVCFSPDGLMVASGSEDQLVYLWDFPNGTQIRALKGHSGAVYTVCFSPDGMTIASASADKTIHLWSVHTGSLIKLLKGSPGRVYSACFSPDGLRIASGSRDKMLHIWDSTPPQGLQTKTPKRHLSAIRALWDFSTAKPINIFNDHDRAVRFIAFSPDGRYLTSLDIYENLICWKHKSFKRTTIPGVTTVTDLAKWLAETKCTPINSVRGTLSLVQQAVIFNHPNGSQHTICVLPYSDILCHAVSGYSLAVGTQTGDVHLLDFSQTVTLLC